MLLEDEGTRSAGPDAEKARSADSSLIQVPALRPRVALQEIVASGGEYCKPPTMADPKPPGATAQGCCVTLPSSHRADPLCTPTPKPQLSLWAGQWLARPGQGKGLVTTGTGPAGAFRTGFLFEEVTDV